MTDEGKLSVGKVLDKLRAADGPQKTKLQQLDDKLKAQDDEIARLRAQRLRLEASQRKDG
jgi:hypothetical protein